MNIRLNDKQLTFLKNSLQEAKNKDLFMYLNINIEQYNSINLSESLICQLRDWAGEELQKVGFDKNYELTNEGKILEEIIDILYV